MSAKLIGAGLLLAAALILAHCLCAEAAARVRRIEAYATLVRRVRGQIAGYARPPGEILRRLDAELLAACGLVELPPDTACIIPEHHPLLLPPEAERVVRDFASELGRGYLDEQLTVCDTALRELEALAADARRRLPERKRLVRCACFCSACAIILLLL